MTSRQPPRHRPRPVPPVPPVLVRGACVTHPVPDLWCSTSAAEREAAATSA